MEELIRKIENLKIEIEKAYAFLQPKAIEERIKELEYEVSQPNFWTNQENARRLSQELAEKKKDLEMWGQMMQDAKDALALSEILHPGNEPEAEKELEKNVDELEKHFNQANIKLLLNEKFDTCNAILSFHAGTGGTDAQDWAEMLMRMYMKYADRRGFKTKILEESHGQEAGIKSAALAVEGPYAYGYLKNEHGIHRLVRLSPFNAGNTRETSFALVEVIPEIVDEGEEEMRKEDLQIDTYRASGPGGQHVNKTDSAVRIRHIPTGIVVQCQNERSQIQNREQAMKILKGKLAQLKEEMQVETIEEVKGKHKEVAWGNQIRSYVIHPYTLVKDHRTNCETSQVHEVLEGDLDIFIESALLKKK